ncbi:MAG: hypothetical protein H7Y08_01230 [Rhizobiaceae bacterium]|nr:hypothetical protein [Rhizobiaceae bacterium]
MIATALSRITLLPLLVATVLLGAAPAGSKVPSFIRTATIDGVRGPVYYSPIDRRFHPIASRTITAAVERVATNLN